MSCRDLVEARRAVSPTRSRRVARCGKGLAGRVPGGVRYERRRVLRQLRGLPRRTL